MKQRLVQSFGEGIDLKILIGEANCLALLPPSTSDVAIVTSDKSAGYFTRQWFSRTGQWIGRWWVRYLRSAKFLRELSDVETIHLEFQRAERDAEIAGRRSDVPPRFFQRPQNEITLEGVGGFLEQAFAA